MYNRYVAAEPYTYAPFRDTFQGQGAPPPPSPPPPPPPPHDSQPPPAGFGAGGRTTGGAEDKKPNILSGIFDFIKEKNIDTGDIILIALMILLFIEGGNIEVLIALGLLLIL